MQTTGNLCNRNAGSDGTLRSHDFQSLYNHSFKSAFDNQLHIKVQNYDENSADRSSLQTKKASIKITRGEINKAAGDELIILEQESTEQMSPGLKKPDPRPRS